jgi:tetratricopeptide (TPR) repeat protein
VRSLAAVALAAAIAGGCANRATRPSPFLIKAPGPVDVGAMADVPAAIPREEFERAKREALAARAASKPATLPSIEERDSGLRAALLRLKVAPSVATHLRAAEEYRRVGVQDAAFEHVSEALRLESRSAAAYDGRARLWRDWGFTSAALADAHRAKYFDPTSAEVRNTLATILERRGLCREALVEYREALRLNPGAAWAQQNVLRLTDTCL